ncbi:hypothetical protein A7A76_00695 [Lysobacter enzymogenes]|uniref:GspH/FimT family pseudopilin n=1 Tax=Lysobacter enzymogenes TaxID=69 RepID=UPI0019D2F1E0|nr:GspH/FimT family pseudopilin [Lysobacter enzymogenes]MBN7138474.1 hypothetical protein [Lysobacter enzymogenes]
MRSRRGTQSGFTLLELMVTVAVAAVVVGLAVPSFIATINRSRLAGAANELVASLQMARMEAMRRNVSVTVCRSADQSSCAGSGSWTGWIVVVPDADRDGNANDPSVLQAVQLKSAVRLSSSVADGRVSYRPDGFARTGSGARGAFLNATFDLCIPTTQPAQNVHRVSLTSGGRLATDPIDAKGVCAQ